MTQPKIDIIDLTFFGTDNHLTTHGHLLTFGYLYLSDAIKINDSQQLDNSQEFSKLAENIEGIIKSKTPNIAIRHFDGIGCRGTKTHPRPGNYTWDKENFEKTEIRSSEALSHHVAKGTGSGMQALLDESNDYIEHIIQQNNGQLPQTINLKGYSRGADACIRLANQIFKKHPQIKINMFLVDPVPGPFHRDDDGSYIIPGNVQRLDVTFMKDETIPFYKPQHMGRLVIQNPLTTQVNEHYLEGVHGEALYIDKNKPQSEQKINSFMQTRENLQQFILETTNQDITLPICFRDRKKKPSEQFTYEPQKAPLHAHNKIIENPDEIIDLTRTTDEIDDTEAQKSPPSTPLSPIQMFKNKLIYQRTLVKEKHKNITKDYQSIQSEELRFLIKRCREAQNFYHYHYRKKASKPNVFETLSNTIKRIIEIIQGKNIEEKTKLFPDDYDLVKVQKALNFKPTQDKISELSPEVVNLLNQFISIIKNSVEPDKREIFNQHTTSIEQYQAAHQLYEKIKAKQALDPIDNAFFSRNALGYLTNERLKNLQSLDLEIQETLRINKINQTINKIRQSRKSLFFKENLQTYPEYQEKFISQVNKCLDSQVRLDNQELGLCTLEQKYKIAQNTLKDLIHSEKDSQKLQKLYAIGEAPYIASYMPDTIQENKKTDEDIHINLSRQM